MEHNFCEMRYSNKEAAAEALLFASGGVVTADDLSLVLKVRKPEAEAVMERLERRYRERGGGILLRRVEDGWQLSSNPEYYEDLSAFFAEPASGTLSRAAMETLTIIAYNQPVTRAGIELVRGVNSDGVLAKLIERGLVEERGKADSPGRPSLYGTTELFLKSIGIRDIGALPEIAEPEEAGQEIEKGQEEA